MSAHAPTQDEQRSAESDRPPYPVSERTWMGLAIAAGTVGLLVIAFATAWVVHRVTTKHPMDRVFSGSIHRAVIHVHAGNITIRNAAGPARVHSTARYLTSKPTIRATLRGGVLTFRSNCGRWWLHDCSTNISLSVPPGTAIDMEASQGSITAENLSAPSIRADASHRVRLHLLNDPALVLAHSRRQDVKIWLPRAAYVVDATAALHQTHIGIPRDDLAPRTIEATADHGSVRIEPAR